MKKAKFLFVTVFILLMMVAIATAQSSQPGIPAPPSSPEQMPIGGLEIMAAIGGVYAIRSLWKKADK